MTNGHDALNGGLGNRIVPWIAVVVAIASMFLTVVNPRDDIKLAEARLQLEMKTMAVGLQRQIDDKWPREAHQQYTVGIDVRLSTLDKEVTNLRSLLVTRPEHEKQWTDTTERYDNLRGQLNELRNQFLGTYNIADALKGMQKQIDDLRTRQLSAPPQQLPSAVGSVVLPGQPPPPVSGR